MKYELEKSMIYQNFLINLLLDRFMLEGQDALISYNFCKQNIEVWKIRDVHTKKIKKIWDDFIKWKQIREGERESVSNAGLKCSFV